MRLEDLPPVAGVSHRFVDVGTGVRLHVAEAGSGPPLMLVHGWPQHWYSWHKLIPRLAQDYRVIVPDLRGLGWSDAPPGDYAKATFAADLVALLDTLEIDRVKLLSHDWGGYSSFLVALGHPERVERFVALDIPPPWRGRPQLRNLGLPFFIIYQVILSTPGLGTAVLTRGPRFVRAMIRLGCARRDAFTTAELDIYANVLREPDRARASAAIYRTFLRREMPASFKAGDRSAELAVPTLLLMGAKSPVRRVTLPDPAPNLLVETLPGAGHFLPEEVPDAVLDRALPFLAAT